MTFLSSLATTLLQTYGTDLSQVTVVFPNKRAALFLNEELIRLSDRPLWSPAYTTISDLFRTMALRPTVGEPAEPQGPHPLEVADPIKLICDLHKSFVKCTGIEESLDHFYGWGQLLLADFDDVDKHLAPADKVFANLRDIHEFDDDTYLTQQQRDIIRKFFSNFNEDHNSELKQRFLSLWSHIYDIYVDFNARLAAQGLAYEGALYRHVIENFPEGNASLEQTEGQYVFAGFNLLHPVELALIHRLEAEGRARLIQDTDEETPKEITFISAPTENIQARYVATWLKEHDRIQAGRKTAIVLADESLLQSVIHCLPDEVSKINITTGYPLSQTAAAQGLNQDIHVSKGQVLSSINNPHDGVFRGCPNFGIFFDSCLVKQDKEIDMRCCPSEASSSNDYENRTSGPGARTFREGRNLTPLSPLEQEAYFRLQLILNRLQTLIDSGDLQVSDATLQRLLTQIIASTSIPFHGEPLEGIQVMGVLETRNIDFDHVLLLSCNEGNIPKGINDTSFIPYSIRKAYGLTTVDNKVAIYENYFRRLLQRAKDVTLVYNNSTNDGKTGEMSRFMLQLMVESKHPITYLTLQGGQTPKLHHPQPITKTPAIMERLQGIQLLSPSALSRYLRCPLRFFYQDVCKLSEYEDLEDDLIDNRLFGNIFHKAAHILYSSLSGLVDSGGTNLSLRKHSARGGTTIQRSALPLATEGTQELFERKDRTSIDRAVDEAIKLELFHIEDPKAKMPPLNGLQLINREVIIKYIQQLIEIDLQLSPFTILALETPLFADRGHIISLKKHSARGGTTSQDVFERNNLTAINIGGVADRIDKITLPDGTERIRIIDYKTSNYRPKPLPDVAAIFDPANIRHHSDYYLQSFLYACMIDNSDVPLKKHSARGGTTSQDVFERNNTVISKTPVSPCLLFIQHAGTENYDPTLILGKTPITDITMVKDEFLHHLNLLLSEIYDESRPFIPTDDGSRCRTCPFRNICG